METNTKVIWGLPGTGKTTQLISELHNHIQDKADLGNVCFCTYTKRMGSVIEERVVKKYSLSADEAKDLLTYYGTIHRVCNRLRGHSSRVVTESLKKDFCDTYGYPTSDNGKDSNKVADSSLGGRFFKIRTWLINNMVTKTGFKRHPDSMHITEEMFLRINKKYEAWKNETNLIDFDDMLVDVFNNRIPLGVDIFFLDEFQDITPLQYEIYKMWSKECKKVIIAGDPYQSIYSFMGGSPNFFEAEMENAKKEKNLLILPHSYRLPKASWDFAKNIARRNGIVPKLTCKDAGFAPKKINSSDLFKYINSNKKTFILARARYMCKIASDDLTTLGIPHTCGIAGSGGWTERERNIYNCIYKMQGKKGIITNEEMLAFFQLFKRRFISLPKNKEKMRENLPETCSPVKAMNFFVDNEIETQTTLFDNFADLPSQPKISDIILSSPFSSKYILKKKISEKQEEKINHSLTSYKKILTDTLPHISTIHGAKGDECDDTFLFGDLTYKSYINMGKEENNLFFVGATRHKENLYIIENYTESDYQFNFPQLN